MGDQQILTNTHQIPARNVPSCATTRAAMRRRRRSRAKASRYGTEGPATSRSNGYVMGFTQSDREGGSGAGLRPLWARSLQAQAPGACQTMAPGASQTMATAMLDARTSTGVAGEMGESGMCSRDASTAADNVHMAPAASNERMPAQRKTTTIAKIATSRWCCTSEPGGSEFR